MKIDITRLNGYREDMTAEEKIALIENADLDVVSKEVFDKKASERAKYSKELKTSRTEEDSRKAETDTKIAELETLVQNLTAEKTMNEYTSKFMGLNFSEEKAKESAKALFNGDMNKVFANIAEFNKGAVEQAKADLIKNTPAPVGGTRSKGSANTKKFEDMSYTELANLYRDDKARYDRMTNN